MKNLNNSLYPQGGFQEISIFLDATSKWRVSGSDSLEKLVKSSLMGREEGRWAFSGR